jgi:ABC-type antimicrobial peptide transport system permease subunit
MNNQATFVDMTAHSGVEASSNFALYENDEIDVDNRKFVAAVLLADSNFLKICDYPIISGTHRLTDRNSALITQRFAQKLFGEENPVGKTFRHITGENLTITGIIGQTSTKSTLSFDVIASLNLHDIMSQWQTNQTFVLLYQGVDYKTVNRQYEDFFEMDYRWDIRHIRYQLFPLPEVYLDKSVSNYVFRQGNYAHVNVLLAVGFLILLSGVLNFINVCTVVVMRRGRELGIKKVFGAGRHHIFIQLAMENFLLTSLALVVAFLLASGVTPFISNVLLLEQIPNIRFDTFLSFVILLSLPVLTTLYPFLRYHYSSPVDSMRNINKIRGVGVRRIFLSFQYVITICLIVVSLFFIKQLRFMLNADLGYRTENIIKVQFLRFKPGGGKISREEREQKREQEERIADEITHKMNASPLFSHWAYGRSPNEFTNYGLQFKLADGENKAVNVQHVDERWLKLFDIQLLEGRLWDDEMDSFFDYSLIVSESVLRLFGITDFNNALLQPESRLWMSLLRPEEEMRTNPPYRIVGVVRDFDFLHLSQKQAPLVFPYSKGMRTEQLMASIVPGRTQDAIDFLRNLYDETIGGEFAYSFVEDEVRQMYKEDKKIATIYTVFTFIAIFVSVLGLFSMSLFDIQSRRKEIAIRKINGASFQDIIRLLLKNYFWTLGISFLIATPVALYAINRYLEGFAHKALVSWWLFAVALAITAGISLLTLIWQTYVAANQNPAEVVKSE